jgi:hypothetical protein
MKQNHHQVARQSSRPSAAPQPKTNAHKATVPRPHQRAGIITCVLILPDGSEFARVDFPSDVFARIEQVALKQGISLGELFIRALRNYIRSQSVRRAT